MRDKKCRLIIYTYRKNQNVDQQQKLLSTFSHSEGKYNNNSWIVLKAAIKAKLLSTLV